MSANDMSHVKVGDSVAITSGHSRAATVGVVHKVGRKYFHVGRDRFALTDGREVTEYTPRVATTPERAAVNARRAAALKTINAARDWNFGQSTPIELLEQLAELVAKCGER